MRKKVSIADRLKANYSFWTLIGLLLATFLLGGGSRDDITSLVLLRPFAMICLVIGLYGLSKEDWRGYRVPLGFMVAIVALILLHLIPLPPFLWTMLPGRELAIAAGEAVGPTQPWRPISLVPYRAENAFYAMLVPAAAMALAIRIDTEQRRKILYLFLGFGIVCALWGIVQSVGGFSRSFYFYSITSTNVPTGFFANRNHTAALFVSMLPMLALVAGRAKEPNKLVRQFVCLGLAGLLLLMTFATGSRGGLVFSLVGLAGAAVVWRSRPQAVTGRRRGKRDLTPYFVAAACVLGIAGFAVIMSRADGLDRIMQTEQSEEGRLLAWETIVGFLPDYLPFGSGIGSFVEIFKVHEPDEMLALNYWNHAHNDWLEWALEGGIPAIILMAAAIFAFFKTARFLIAGSYSGRLDVQLGLVGTVIIFVLGLWSIVDYPLRVPSLACLAAISAVWMAAPRLAPPRQG